MAFLEYDPEETLEYYIQDSDLLDELSRDGLQERIESLFWAGEEFSPYQKSVFLSFFLYLTGDHKRLRVICERLSRIQNKDWIPLDPESYLDGWFSGEAPGDAVVNPAAIKSGPLLRLPELEALISSRATAYIDRIKTAFRVFFERTDEKLFLESCEIHTEELRDPELKANSLRWEYKYLGREPDKIKKRWEIYRKRQSEWPKLN